MELKNILKNTKPKLSVGFDEISWKFLKSSPENIIIALSHIFNLSLQSGKIISSFKTAKMIPLYKKVMLVTLTITDQSAYSQIYLKFWKKLCIEEL